MAKDALVQRFTSLFELCRKLPFYFDNVFRWGTWDRDDSMWMLRWAGLVNLICIGYHSRFDEEQMGRRGNEANWWRECRNTCCHSYGVSVDNRRISENGTLQGNYNGVAQWEITETVFSKLWTQSG